LKKQQPKKKTYTSLYLSLFLIVMCFVLYGNTLNNWYALDDAMMITENNVTQKGFAGIKEHLSHGFLYGFLGKEGTDAGSSRWRPMSLVTYSMEIGLWGKNKPQKSHLINIILYAAIAYLLFRLLSVYWIKNIWLSFFATLLFVLHPIHTEVVANIKGRDELLCLFFVLLSLCRLWKYLQDPQRIHYILALLYFFFALMSKESAITFVAGVPLALYFFSNLDFKKIGMYASGFLGAAVVYLLIRNAIVPLTGIKPSDEVMNNPFLYATGMQALFTKIYVMLLYLKLLVFPNPLVYDYSYNQIPYVNGSNPWVWVSVLVYAALFIYALTGIKKKALFSFCILMFFVTFSVSTNLILEIGTLMGERLLFIPSIFAAVLLAAAGMKLYSLLIDRANVKKEIALAVLIVPVFLFCTLKTIGRNKEWNDDITLNIADIEKSPNSAKINHGTGGAYITLADRSAPELKDSLINNAIHYYQRALEIFPQYSDAYLGLGVAYSRINNLPETEKNWNIFRKKAPDHPKLLQCDAYLTYQFYAKGQDYLYKNKYDSSIINLEKVLTYSHDNSDSLKLQSLYDLGGMYYAKGAYKESYERLSELEKINPNFRTVTQGLDAAKKALGMPTDSIK
jgi:hypothetical protein